MRTTIKIIPIFMLAIFTATPCHTQPNDIYRETITINNKNISIYDAFNQLKLKYDVNIKIKGSIPESTISLNIQNGTIKEAVTTTLKEAKINNYTFAINYYTKEIVISILPQGDRQDKSAKNHGSVRHTRPINNNDFVQIEEVAKSDESENGPIKPFTYEEIENLVNTYETKQITNNSQSTPFTTEQIFELQSNYGKKISDDSSTQINIDDTVSDKAALSSIYDKINEPLSTEQIQKLKNLYGDSVSSDVNLDM